MVKYNSFFDIKQILNEYSEEIQEEITLEAKRLGVESTNKLRKNSPKSKNSKRSGKYSKGWKVKTREGKGFVNVIIYNKTDYQLTHLLENGHLAKNGKRVKGIIHIAPIHDELIETYSKNVEKIIKRGEKNATN